MTGVIKRIAQDLEKEVERIVERQKKLGVDITFTQACKIAAKKLRGEKICEDISLKL